MLLVGDGPLAWADNSTIEKTVRHVVSLGNRAAGSPGANQVADFIASEFIRLGLQHVDTHEFTLPMRRVLRSIIQLPDQDKPLPIDSMTLNAVSPGTICAPGITAPLIYVGNGELSQLNGKTIKDAVVLMELSSGRNWLNVASLGAKALIYIDRGPTAKFFYKDKIELSPVDFPRLRLSLERARQYFGDFENQPKGEVLPWVRLESDIHWEEVHAKNVYAYLKGSDPDLSKSIILVEAFYDGSGFLPGHTQGADEAVSIAALLELAQYLKHHPPARSIVFVATSGHSQTLVGMREMVWAFVSRNKEMRDSERRLKKLIRHCSEQLTLLNEVSFSNEILKKKDGTLLKTALTETIKNEVDRISRDLMRLHTDNERKIDSEKLQILKNRRLHLRRLDWNENFSDLIKKDILLLNKLIPLAQKRLNTKKRDAKKQLRLLKSAGTFRSLIKSGELDLVISLHLSSHGDGFGAFNKGFLHPLKPTINRVPAYSFLDNVLRQGAGKAAKELNLKSLFKDTLRPSRRRSWDSYFLDRPALGGEISALAGLMGITLVTTNDARPYWGTPYDKLESVDWPNASCQSIFISRMIEYLASVPKLHNDLYPRDGFAEIRGRANFLRQGELFANQPAPGSLLISYQGPGIYYNFVDTSGLFHIKGVTDKKHLLHKVIIEGYRFEPETGKVIWAIDKNQTGKDAYRVKMERSNMEIALVMFACRQSTVFNLLEPRNFNYMTKPDIIDGRTETTPARYWYSRIDTMDSTISSIYLEPEVPFKLILSDTILKKKLILTHADEDHSMGTGYRLEDWPTITPTEFYVAKDMWALLSPRIDNLETHGIRDSRIDDLKREGLNALDSATKAYQNQRYDRFFENVRRSWALASRVYDQVEKVQKDVLLGVLFYVALFVPFAFCLERLLFSFSNIYKRIMAFVVILVLLITVIYKVHPAFELAYNPMVVILAFFIIGLSFMVALIIFFRFEEEMTLLQRHAKQMRIEEISNWKAFLAAFFIGVGNLRRRRLRTVLTCITLIILTFAIMSFTTVKTTRMHSRILFQSDAAYQGFLLKNIDWWDLPQESLEIIVNTFGPDALAAPRAWLEAEDKTRVIPIQIKHKDKIGEIRALIGLSASEPQVTGIDKILTQGRWVDQDKTDEIILPQRLAKNVGLNLTQTRNPKVELWGMEFKVVGIFSEARLQAQTDLDGEPLTPVTFPGEASMEMTEVEMEALESGDDVRSFQSRYQHVAADVTAIMPIKLILAAGGKLKAIAIQPTSKQKSDSALTALAHNLVDRFGLSLFSGEKEGTFLYNASDTLSYSGVPNILIPLIISVLIVLNTMIGSVYERKREIGIYTSIGLAPSHVSFLFIAEAMAFAVLSVVLGYIIAQTCAKLFAQTSLWAGITVNYSSLAGVAAMLLVILVVLISAIYPSKVAVKIAIPDVRRTWKLPETKNNSLKLTLPFLLKSGEERSVCGYLYEYLDSHQDISHGFFLTDNLKIDMVFAPKKETSDPKVAGKNSCDRDPYLQLQSMVWLAPFDFGITQKVRMLICPSDHEPGFMEIKVTIDRSAGEVNVWRRINRVFIHRLRRRLLLWRSLDVQQKVGCENLIKFL
jgi:ABC-type antimicrobial peptide transport system permease subunit